MTSQGTGHRPQGTGRSLRRSAFSCRPAMRLATAMSLVLGFVGLAHAAKDAQIPDWVVQASTNAPLKGEWRSFFWKTRC